jgi:hypothetical protein
VEVCWRGTSSSWMELVSNSLCVTAVLLATAISRWSQDMIQHAVVVAEIALTIFNVRCRRLNRVTAGPAGLR